MFNILFWFPITAAAVVVMMNENNMAGLLPYLPLCHESESELWTPDEGWVARLGPVAGSLPVVCAALSLTPATVAPHQLRFYTASLTHNWPLTQLRVITE